MHSILVLIAIFGYASAKFAFPVPSYYAVEKAFRTVRPAIKWDPTNLLTDLAGPLAMCDRLSDWGTAGKKTAVQAETVWNATRIDPIFFPARDTYVVYYFILQATGADARAVASDINTAAQNMQRANFQGAPYTELNSDLQSTVRFGCSVEPQCPTSAGTQARTVVVCLLAQTTVLPEFFVQGFNETWKAHSHDPYTGVSQATFPEGQEFPGYVYVEDEMVVKEVVGNDLCDKYAYDPASFIKTINDYWKNPSPPFIHTLGTTKTTGYYLAFVANANATSLDFIVVGRDGTIPKNFNQQVLTKLFGKTSADRNAVLAKNPTVDLNTGACILAICPGRMLPKGGTSGGKLTTKGNYVVMACMTFKTDDAGVE